MTEQQFTNKINQLLQENRIEEASKLMDKLDEGIFNTIRRGIGTAAQGVGNFLDWDTARKWGAKQKGIARGNAAGRQQNSQDVEQQSYDEAYKAKTQQAQGKVDPNNPKTDQQTKEVPEEPAPAPEKVKQTPQRRGRSTKTSPDTNSNQSPPTDPQQEISSRRKTFLNYVQRSLEDIKNQKQGKLSSKELLQMARTAKILNDSKIETALFGNVLKIRLREEERYNRLKERQK